MPKNKIPENTGKYFTLINTSNKRFMLPDNTLLDFRIGMPFNSLELYKKGEFPYLGLKDGAEILFKNESVDNLIKYIKNSTRKEDILILGKVSNHAKIKAIIEEKLV